MSQVDYQWTVEFLDEFTEGEGTNIEVVEIHHCDSYAECMGIVSDEHIYDYAWIVLVVDEYEMNGGRAWATCRDEKLPEFLTDAYKRKFRKVPKRFHQEVARYHAKKNAD